MTNYEFTGDYRAFASSGQTESIWQTCREHREIITRQLVRAATQGAKSLCVFGAGPCNDIDLKLVLTAYENVTLVDHDPRTLAAGVASQGANKAPGLHLAGEVDLLGVSRLLTNYREENDDALLEQALSSISSFRPTGLATYDCVASTCILSQLLYEASAAIDKNHFRFVEVLKSIRHKHIDLMLSVLNPGGRGILITDFVSSESLPELTNTGNLKQTLKRAIANQNFLHGLNPPMVARVFQDDRFGGQLSSVKVSDPWLWALPQITYACFAIVFEKADSQPK